APAPAQGRPREMKQYYGYGRGYDPPDRREVNDQPLTFPVALLLLLGIFASAVIYSASLSSGGEDETITEGLRIEEVFFILEGVDEDSMTIDINIYITNVGNQDSGVINISAFAENTDNKITYAQGSAVIPVIEGERSKNTTITMDLDKNQSFIIKIRLFEDGMIKIKGSAEVTTGELSQSAEKFVTNDGRPDAAGNGTDSGKSEDSGGFVPGFALVPVIASIGLAAVLVLRKRGRRHE
ncbi:MAG: hypothetical protein KAU14_02195, partial [Thermoplasmata archaeon]|nr:hypothetical protein [Thermoplasmata archaeon]